MDWAVPARLGRQLSAAGRRAGGIKEQGEETWTQKAEERLLRKTAGH
jgi:hypothetical protein